MTTPALYWDSSHGGGLVFNLLLFSEVLPAFSFSLSSDSHPLLSLFTSVFCSAHFPSSSTLSSFLLLPLLCSYHLSVCRLKPPPFLLLLLLLFVGPMYSRPARCYAVYPCITMTTLPAPAVKVFLGELTCERRAVLRRKEESAERVMKKNKFHPL